MVKQRINPETLELEQVETVERPSKVNRSARPQRVPIHGYKSKLDVKGLKPGMHGCWVNDYNVDRYLAAGYDFVTYDVQVGDRHVNTASQIGNKVSMAAGNGLTAYLMECPEEIYQEELGEVHRLADEKDEMMRRSSQNIEGGYGAVTIGRPKPGTKLV